MYLQTTKINKIRKNRVTFSRKLTIRGNETENFLENDNLVLINSLESTHIILPTAIF